MTAASRVGFLAPVAACAGLQVVVLYLFSGGSDALFAFFGAWGWLGVHLVAPVVGLAMLAWQARAPGVVKPRAEPRLWLTLAPVCVVAVIGTGVGLAALLAPAVTAKAWPWPVSTLDIRALGVWALTFGVGSAWAVGDSNPERQLTGAVSYLVAGTASLVALVRYAGEVRWGTLGAAGRLMAGPADRWQPAALTD
ncbi:MAG TPA: hypothetical protein VFE14_10490 [Micromonosporaceae bacterium]|nr:hypothetical protein [Micromonosporaceae bacterium]